jgi:predicted peroxiredoxin
MSPYLLIETRSHLESPEVEDFVDLAARLGEDGHRVDLFLVQNGVLLAGGDCARLAEALRRPGVHVWADEFSIASRSLRPAELLEGVRVAGMDTLVELLVRPQGKAIWH